MIYHFLRTVAWIVSHLPRPWTLGLGSLLGGLLYLAIPYRKQVAWQNLARAFPDKSPRQRAVILKDTYQHFGMVLMDFVRIPTISDQRLGEVIDFDETYVQEAQNTGRGAIIVTGHLGNWEMGHLAMCRRGYPMVFVVIPQRGGRGRFLETVRMATGSRILSRRTSPHTMMRLLNDGNFLLLAGDQNVRKGGIWVTFFNCPLSRPRGAAVFALRTGAPLLFLACTLGKDHRYRLTFTPIPHDHLPNDHRHAIQVLLQRYQDRLEAAVRQHPEQYFNWFHRMWKTQPEGS